MADTASVDLYCDINDSTMVKANPDGASRQDEIVVICGEDHGDQAVQATSMGQDKSEGEIGCSVGPNESATGRA
ncbi:MAG: hypothetical protein ABSA12_02530 [Verrucomicrobiia bacterium]|jgi:hypothetical protein